MHGVSHPKILKKDKPHKVSDKQEDFSVSTSGKNGIKLWFTCMIVVTILL